MPEIVDEGVTGFVVDSIDEARRRGGRGSASSTAARCGRSSNGASRPIAWSATTRRSMRRWSQRLGRSELGDREPADLRRRRDERDMSAMAHTRRTKTRSRRWRWRRSTTARRASRTGSSRSSMAIVSSSRTPMAISAAAGDGLFRDDTRVLSRFPAVRRRPDAVAARRLAQPGQHPVHRQPDQSAADDAGRQRDAAGRRPYRALAVRSGRTGCSSASRSPTIGQRCRHARLRCASPPISATCSRCAARRAAGAAGPMTPRSAGPASCFAMTGWTRSCAGRRSRSRRRPSASSADRADFRSPLPRRGSESLFIEVGAEQRATPTRERFRAAAARARFGDAGQAPPWRHGAQFRPRLQRLAVARPRRHRAADHRS